MLEEKKRFSTIAAPWLCIFNTNIFCASTQKLLARSYVTRVRSKLTLKNERSDPRAICKHRERARGRKRRKSPAVFFNCTHQACAADLYVLLSSGTRIYMHMRRVFAERVQEGRWGLRLACTQRCARLRGWPMLPLDSSRLLRVIRAVHSCFSKAEACSWSMHMVYYYFYYNLATMRALNIYRVIK